MRKISKLVLVVVTAASLLCFLFYKVQYDRLHNVLQVLEFFGSAANATASDDLKSPIVGLVPAWQVVTQQLFVYSAFCDQREVGEEECAKVTALAAASTSVGVDKRFGCKFWYEGTVRPVHGIPFVAPLRNDVPAAAEGETAASLTPHLLTCESKFSSLTPFAVTFSSGRSEGFVHVHRRPAKGGRKKDLVACVAPQSTPGDSMQLLTEQILLQDYFQVQDFVVYDGGLTNGFASTVASKASDDPSFRIQVLPWNLPPGIDGPSSWLLARTDCHFRTRRLHWANVFLKPGQVLVQRSRREKFLANALKRISANAQRLDVSVRRFCAEAPLDEPSKSLESAINALRMSTYDRAKSLNESKVSVVFGGGGNGGIFEANPEELLVYDYSACGDYEMVKDGDNADTESLDGFVTEQAKEIQLKMGKYFQKLV